MKLHSIHDPAQIQKREKVRIVQGEVVRTHIWQDQHGHEYEKQNTKFIPKQSSSSSLDDEFLFILIMVLLIVFMIFWIGFLCGRYRSVTSVKVSVRGAVS